MSDEQEGMGFSIESLLMTTEHIIQGHLNFLKSLEIA